VKIAEKKIIPLGMKRSVEKQQAHRTHSDRNAPCDQQFSIKRHIPNGM